VHDHLLFDAWAGEYDESIANSLDRYPFEGYYQVLTTILNKAEISPGDVVLDIGIGTGTLSEPLYQAGCEIIGVDFSGEMLQRARQKMPGLIAVVHDFTKPMPDAVKQHEPTQVISSYALHHLDQDQKVAFVREILHDLIPAKGRLVVGDVAFENMADLQRTRERWASIWDDEEHYLVADQLLPRLTDLGIFCEFTRIGSCAGVLVCQRDD